MNVKVEFTEGYEKRFTEACCRILARSGKQGITAPPEKKKKQLLTAGIEQTQSLLRA